MEPLTIFQDAWRWFPHTYAQTASSGAWKPFPYLRRMSELITPALIRGGGRFIVTVPPRHGKSEFLSHWIPTWFLDTFPWRRVGLATYAAHFSRKWGKKVKREFAGNPRVLHRLADDSKAGDRFEISCETEKRDNGGMVTAGVDGPFTGEGFDLLLIDDPVKNWKEANSETRRESIKEWYRSVARTRLEPGGTVIILMTRWHQNDLAGWLIGMKDDPEEDPEIREDWTVINLPALAEEGDPMGRPVGAALCPERYGEKALLKIKRTVGPRVWDALYQQRPTSATGDVWRRSWWKFYKAVPPRFDELIQSWDFRFGDKQESGSFVVGQIWGRLKNHYYLVDEVRGRWGYIESKKQLLRLCARYPKAYKKLIENKANGSAIENDLKNHVTGLFLVNPEGGKFARATACEGPISSGNVWIPDPDAFPWSGEFIEETAAFTANGSHELDDRVDAASQAITYFEKKTNSAILKLLKQ